VNALGFFRTKLSLWAAITAALILAAGCIPIVRSAEERFGYWGCWGVVLRGGAFVGTLADTAMILIIHGGAWGLVLTTLGWIAQRVLLAALFRGTPDRAGVRESLPRLNVRPFHWSTLIPAIIVVGSLVSPFVAWRHGSSTTSFHARVHNADMMSRAAYGRNRTAPSLIRKLAPPRCRLQKWYRSHGLSVRPGP